MPRSKRQQTKRLLKQLFELQRSDWELTGPFCLETKFILKNNKYCTSVEVTGDKLADSFVKPVDRSLIPKFVLSQLDFQKLTHESEPQVQLTPFLDFILASLPDYLFKGIASPTFFHWHCAEVHRTYFVVAYLYKDIAMSSGVYNLQTLLSLRGRRPPPGLADIVERDRDLADVVTSAGGNRQETAPATSCKAELNSGMTAPKSSDDSSTGSDEIVYKGVASRCAVPLGETEWKFRGRSASELTTNEPLSAPTGLNAQQSEGFQRFYKAVVSPTHVRVTAGGRIVPNTRGSSSPTSKRVKEKMPIDSSAINGQSSGQPGQNQSEGMTAGKLPAFPMFPPHFYPAPPPFPGAFPHLGAAMPMMPMPPGFGIPPGFQLPHMAVNGVATASSGSDAVHKENQSKAAENGQTSRSDQHQSALKTEDKVKISPPEQFDHTKPFTYNGQLVYPFPVYPPQMAPQMAAYMPPGFMGHPGFAVPFPGPMMPAPGPQAAMNPVFPHMGMPAATPAPAPAMPPSNGIVNARMASATTGRLPPNAPPISSIRPSDISKKQIDSLRNSRKYHEDQLQYNRHQIDEKEIERTIAMLDEQIRRFSKMNQDQLLYEERHYPKRDMPKDVAVSTGTRTALPSKVSGYDETKTDTASQPGSGTGSIRKLDGVRVRANVDTDQKTQRAFSLDTVETPVRWNDPVKKSSLPSGAALAPPFEPRSSGSIEQSAVATGEMDGTVEKRLFSAGNGTWCNWTHPSSGARISSGSVGHSEVHSSTEDQGYLGVPYLVGSLPVGMNPKTAKDADYLYVRPLTEDEARARYLYWGKAPLEVRQGLPKYDGRNFYPASPVKTQQSTTRSELSHGGTPDVGFAFEHSVARDTTDPFRPPTPQNRIGLASKENTPPNQTETTKAGKERVTTRGPTASENDITKLAEAQDRRLGDSTGARLVHNMLKRSITRSNDVLPSTVTSTTAQGFLPAYSGYDTLTASLSPILVPSDSSSRPSPEKPSEEDGALVSPMVEKHGENRRPPIGNAGAVLLEEEFRNIVPVDTKYRSALPTHWKAV